MVRPFLGLPVPDPHHRLNDVWASSDGGLRLFPTFLGLDCPGCFPAELVHRCLYLLTRLNLLLLDRLKLKRLLLSIGAVMFLFAKGILATQAQPKRACITSPLNTGTARTWTH